MLIGTRGAQVKALAIVTRHSFLHIYKPILLLALDDYFKTPTEGTLANLFESVNAMDLSSMPRLNQLERLILLQSDRDDLFSERFPGPQRERSGTASSETSNLSVGFENMLLEPLTPLLGGAPPSNVTLRDTHEYNTSITYNNTTIPIKVPMTSLPEIVGDFSMVQLINTFSKAASMTTYPLHSYLTTSGPTTHPVIVLLNALLSQKRVVFLGQTQPSGNVANYVLAACGMASGGTGLLRSFTERAFPYTDLSKIEDLLTVDGFIAGVTNGIFELHPEWWDVMANIDTGQVIISSSLVPDGIGPPGTTTAAWSSTDSGDVAFMEDVTTSIADRASEHAIRLKFRDFLTRFLKLATVYEESTFAESPLSPDPEAADGPYLLPGHGIVFLDPFARKRELAANAARIEAWLGTESYRCAVSDRAAQFARGSARVRTFDLAHQLDRLRLLDDAAATSATASQIVSHHGGGASPSISPVSGVGGAAAAAAAPSAASASVTTLSGAALSTDASAAIYVLLNREVLSDVHLAELLTLTPLSGGGLAVLGAGLFHPSPAARRAVVFLLERVREHAVGRYFYAALSRFYRAAQERMLREHDMEDG